MGESGGGRSGVTPTILVLGAGGMLGHKILQRLRVEFPSTCCTLRGRVTDYPYANIPMFHEQGVFGGIDALNTQQLHALLTRLRPDVVVNCIGVIKQRKTAREALTTIRLNAVLPHEIAETCAAWGGRVIHFSTDCVFSGHRGNYAEDDVSDAEDLYGRAKCLGELSGELTLTLRTSIIGRELTQHRSLLDWFLSQQRKTVRGFTRAMFSGVTTNHLATLVATLIRDGMPISGLYQVASRSISKHDLLSLIRDTYKLEIDIIPDSTFVIDRSMTGAKLEAAIGYRCPPWNELIAELASDPTPYEEWLHYETV